MPFWEFFVLFVWCLLLLTFFWMMLGRMFNPHVRKILHHGKRTPLVEDYWDLPEGLPEKHGW